MLYAPNAKSTGECYNSEGAAVDGAVLHWRSTDVKSMRMETVVSNVNGQLRLKVGHGECAFWTGSLQFRDASIKGLCAPLILFTQATLVFPMQPLQP